MQTWLKWLILGGAFLLVGLLALGNAMLASVAVASLVGVLVLLAGLGQAWMGLRDSEDGQRLLHIGIGALLALLGLSFLVNPVSGAVTLALLVTVFILGGGVLRLFLAWRMKQTPYFWGMLLSGALSVLLALFVLATPGATVALLGLLLGIELIFGGIGLIALSLFLRAGRS